MKIEQTHWTRPTGWRPEPPGGLGASAQLVFVFGATELLKSPEHRDELRRAYPNAQMVGCSTAGEICDTSVRDNSVTATAVCFQGARVELAHATIDDRSQSAVVGEHLARALEHDGLVHALVISDGSSINGSELVKGLTRHLPDGVTVTGGLAGDGARMEETLVLWDGGAHRDRVVIVGFYGSSLRVGYGSLGGWDPFGPERLVTRSEGSVLYELDGKSALELYKLYLGDHAKDLPSSALLFPLSLRTSDDDRPVVRTILGINEEDQSMTFAGEVPTGAYVRLMKANFDRLIDGAAAAARTSYEALGERSPDLALLISCVGRKLVLKQRVEEEVEGVRDVLGESAVLTGFYSNGEIAPFTASARCELHNQTMTITTLSER